MTIGHFVAPRRGIVIALIVIAAVAAASDFFLRTSPSRVVVRYGITPYQDSALPVVAEMKGWYREQGIEVQLVPLAWGDIVTALSSGAIDAAIYNFNSFLPPYQNAAQGTAKPLFYAPLYIFKGQAIMVHPQSGFQITNPSAATNTPLDSAEIIRRASDLKGKRIGVTKGTELEQIVLAALAKAGLSASDAQIIYAAPEDSLAAFLAGNLDAFAAGLTERIEARRHGAIELLTQADVMMPVTDGLVTTDVFASKNQAALDKLVTSWFRTIQYIQEDVPKNSAEIRDYLRTSASTRYTPEEYAIAWTFDDFPTTPKAANEVFNNKDSKFYWKSSWDYVAKFLIDQKQITQVPPYNAYAGEDTLKRLSSP